MQKSQGTWPSRQTGKQATTASALCLRRSEVLRNFHKAQDVKPLISWRRQAQDLERGEHSVIFLENIRKGLGQSDQHCSCFNGNTGKTSRRQDEVMGFSVCRDTVLNWTATNDDPFTCTRSEDVGVAASSSERELEGHRIKFPSVTITCQFSPLTCSIQIWKRYGPSEKAGITDKSHSFHRSVLGVLL